MTQVVVVRRSNAKGRTLYSQGGAYHIITPNTDDALDRIGAMFKDGALNIRKRSCYEEGDSLVVHVVAMGSKPNHNQMHVTLARSDEYTLRKA